MEGQPARMHADGTQAPPPIPVHADPLAGLVTGETTRAAVSGTDSSGFGELNQRRFPSDSGAMNERIRAVLEGEDLPEGDSTAGQRPQGTPAPGQYRRPDQRTGPSRWRSGAQAQARRVRDDAPVRTSAGVSAAVVLVVIFGILALAVVLGIAGSISESIS